MFVFVNKHKGWMIGAVALLAALAGLYLFGRQMTNESGYILKLEIALRDGDAARVADLLHTDNDKVVMDEAKAKTILAYLNQHGRLDEEMKALRERSGGTGSDGLFAARKDGKRFGIYDRYRIVVHTSTVEAHTNYRGATIKLNGKTVATADSDDYLTKIGPLVPGSYRLEAEYVGDYTTLKSEQAVTVGGVQKDPVDLSLNGEMVTVDANYEGAAIFIDGKDTGTRTGGNDRLGPVSLDGASQVYAEKTFPWGAAKSKPVPINGRSMHLQIDPNTDALKEAVMGAATGFIRSWMDAYNKLDPSVVPHLSPDRKASLASSIEEFKANGLIYEARLKKLVFDTDSIYIQQEADGSFRTAVSVQSTYAQRSYAGGESPPEPAEYTDTIAYRLIFENGDWVVTDWYEDYDFSAKHTKVKTF